MKAISRDQLVEAMTGEARRGPVVRGPVVSSRPKVDGDKATCAARVTGEWIGAIYGAIILAALMLAPRNFRPGAGLEERLP